MPGWSFADVWEVVAQQVPDATAQVQGDRRISWRDFDRRANGIAQAFLDAGRARSRTRSPSTSTTAPSTSSRCTPRFKAGLAPINTNYRYLDDELVYLWDNGDVVAVVFHGTFAERIEGIRDRLPRRSSCGCGSTTAAAPAPSGPRPTRPPPKPARRKPVQGPWGRDGDHLLLLYTGGTTGMPKGVMWRQDDLFRTPRRHLHPGRAATPSPTSQLIRDAVQAPGLDRHAGLPAHARHRAASPS